METKERIIEEAANMFRTYGIRAVTMDMLATRMGMSKRTIYEVFKDKDELLHGVMIWMVKKQSELINHCLESSGNVIGAVFMMMDIMMDHYRKMSAAFKLDMKRYHNEIKRKMEMDNAFPYENSRAILVRGVKEGIFRSDLDIDMTDRCLKEMTKINGQEEPGDLDNEEMIRNFFVNYLRGISTDKGLALINKYDKKITGNNRIK